MKKIGADVYYTDTGKGRAIVLLHGFLESSVIWNDLAESLSKHYRVICIDLPGHGKTPSIGYIHTMEMMADVVKGVLEKLQLRRVVIAGHSMGGYVACALAEKFPEMISGLALVNSTASADSEEKKKDRARAIEAVKNDHTSFVNELSERLFFEENRARLKDKIDLIKSTGAVVSKQGLIACLEGMKERKGREHVIAKSNFPGLYIIGKHDTVLSWEKLVKEARSGKPFDYLILENSGHMSFFEEPLLIEKALRKLARRAFRLKRSTI